MTFVERLPLRSAKFRTGWVICCVVVTVTAAAAIVLPNLFPFSDPSGVLETYSSAGALNENGPFFQPLGTNGRSCSTCHLAKNAFGLSAATAERVYEATNGQDPLFAPVDGAACPQQQPPNFELLRHYGLIRVALPLAADPQFTISVVHDTYGCALITDPTSGIVTISVYRRPLPATNVGFLTAVQFDGRENILPLNNQQTFAANLIADLKHQALDATMGHAQAIVPPTDAQLTAIVAFEAGLNSAQVVDSRAGALSSDGANGGPVFLKNVAFFPGINDSLGGNPTGALFNPRTFTLYSSWIASDDPYRRSVARGEEIFNTRPLLITNVRGLNDALKQSVITGTCSTCHDTPNVGNHSLPVPLEIGTSRSPVFETDPQVQAAVSQLSMPDLPVFEIVCNQGPHAGEITYTSDPGRATLTGSCADVGRGKGLILRGLAARAPYFHNGAAASLDEVVDFYNLRFRMNLTGQEKLDLVNFLKTL